MKTKGGRTLWMKLLSQYLCLGVSFILQHKLTSLFLKLYYPLFLSFRSCRNKGMGGSVCEQVRVRTCTVLLPFHLLKQHSGKHRDVTAGQSSAEIFSC